MGFPLRKHKSLWTGKNQKLSTDILNEGGLRACEGICICCSFGTPEACWRIVGWLNSVKKEGSGQISSPSDSANAH